MSTEATARLWKVSDRKYDGTGRPSTDFTVSRDGVFIAAFANEQDATDAARAVNAHADLVAALEAVEWVEDTYASDQVAEQALMCASCSGWKPEGHAPDCQLALALAKGRAE